MADSIIKNVEIWNLVKSKPYLSPPKISDNKYRRGVLGCVTGDRKYPGAALMTTAAALATGVGMVRYFGPKKVAKEVIQFRPAVVTSNGPIDALLIGSGVNHGLRAKFRIYKFKNSKVPRILDAGALHLAKQDRNLTIITPHAGELSKLIGVESSEIEANPEKYALQAARNYKVTVLLKGWQSVVANSDRIIKLPPAPTWLATAGTGDVLAGILGALVAINCKSLTENNLIEIGATASLLHSEAAKRSSVGPIDIESMIKEISKTIINIANHD